MPDPRPLADAVWKAETTRKVATFLNENGYEEQVTAKTLNAPSSKAYGAMLQFCFRHIDPNYTMKGPLEEEGPVLFRMLEYPVAIQKAEFKVITPHQWPRLLAALAW
jgi:SMC interacting uncharacterized protein involved in chromosome segregation